MTKTAHIHAGDFRALARLATQGTVGLVDLVEAFHSTIGRSLGLTGLVYNSVRGVARLVGGGLDAILFQLEPMLGERGCSPEREAVLAALNGVLGDYLVASGNPLAIRMSLRQGGRALAVDSAAPMAAMPYSSGKIVVLIHGLCLNDLQWNQRGHDHGAVLAQIGYTPVYLHYNSGLHISTNGRALAALLETLVKQWPNPVEELAIVAHSMGGLLARSACHYAAEAGHVWPRYLRKMAFLGTPHHGAPLERAGNWLETVVAGIPYAGPVARLGKIRSAGITDLRHGNVLDEDWEGSDRFASASDNRRCVALPGGVECYAVAATAGHKRGDVRDRLLGDGLVPVSSALGLHADAARSLLFPQSRQWIGYGMTHLDLLRRAEVSDQLAQWWAPARKQRLVSKKRGQPAAAILRAQ